MSVKRENSPASLWNDDEMQTVRQTSGWKCWCRLCAKDDGRNNIDVFFKDDNNIPNNDLAMAISKHFHVNIRIDDEIPQFICLECHSLLNSLVAFTQRVSKVQIMFSLMQARIGDRIDVNKLRTKFGLVDVDGLHAFDGMTTTKQTPTDDEEDHQMLEAMVEQRVDDVQPDGDEATMGNDVVILEHMLERDLVDELEQELEQQLEQQLGQELDDDLESAEEYRENSKSSCSHLDEEAGEGEEEEEEEEFEFIDEEETLLSRVRSRARELQKLDDPNDIVLTKVGADDESQEIFIYNNSVDDPPEAGEQHAYDHDDHEEPGDKIIDSLDSNSTASTVSPRPRAKRGRPPKNRALEHPAAGVKRRKGGENGGDEESDVSPLDYKFLCALCPKKYKSLVIYRKHMHEIHDTVDESVADYACEQCEKTFPTERQLGTHLRTHLPLEKKQSFPCPYCDKKFTKESISLQHISGVHLNEKPFICEECGRALKTNAALKEHKLTHTNDCPFECEVCHKRFKNKARLKIHSDIHTSTVYTCDECGLQLNTRRTLTMHMLVHSEEKPFKCDYCGNGFKRAKALKNHLIIHTGLKPYLCNFCQKTFSNGSNCRSHKKKTHPVELAAMEAAGKATTPASMPKLEQLRAVTKAADNLQPVNKHVGLPPNWRDILIKAEQRANFLKGHEQQSPSSPPPLPPPPHSNKTRAKQKETPKGGSAELCVV